MSYVGYNMWLKGPRSLQLKTSSGSQSCRNRSGRSGGHQLSIKTQNMGVATALQYCCSVRLQPHPHFTVCNFYTQHDGWVALSLSIQPITVFSFSSVKAIGLAAGCPILAIVPQICTLRSNFRMSEITEYFTVWPAKNWPGSVSDLKPRLHENMCFTCCG